jgi:hypothetical protein
MKTQKELLHAWTEALNEALERSKRISATPQASSDHVTAAADAVHKLAQAGSLLHLEAPEKA